MNIPKTLVLLLIDNPTYIYSARCGTPNYRLLRTSHMQSHPIRDPNHSIIASLLNLQSYIFDQNVKSASRINSANRKNKPDLPPFNPDRGEPRATDTS